MRMHVSVLAILALVAISTHAGAQPCPELTRLRSEAADASKQTWGGIAPTAQRCEAYGRTANAWDAILQYARQNRELCEISARSLDEFEKYRDEATKTRDNVCSGRPARPFPPEIISR